MSDHFISLNEPIKDDDDLSTIHSDVYIPLTDDNTTMNEIYESSSQMKKGGYDYGLPMLFLVLSCIAPTILHLLNIMFFNGFPLKLCMALLLFLNRVICFYQKITEVSQCSRFLQICMTGSSQIGL